jgi:hypothetical protein
MDLLQLAGYGTDVIGAAVGGWYTSAKILERSMKMDTRQVALDLMEPSSTAARLSGPALGADGDEEPGPKGDGLLGVMLRQAGQPSPAAGLLAVGPVPGPLVPGSLIPGPLSAGSAEDEEIEPEAEKLLGATLAGFGDWLFGLATGWLGWLWQKLAVLGWLRLAVAVPFALVLFGVGSALFGVVLPFAIIGFLLDSDKDFRLRIIVLAFAAGICLEIVSALPG